VSSIPGTIVGNIYVSKGANSVLQGYESMAGQINVETRDPDNTDRLLFNTYLNSFKEKHFNLNYAFKKNNWSNLTAFHTVQPADKTDKDEDNFLDLPLLTRYMLLNKWKYGNEQEWGWNSEIAVRFLNEKREGGQTTFDSESDIGSTSVYGQLVKINQPEFWSKTGFRMNDNHNFAFFASGFHQTQNSYFGTVKYDANQTNLYINAQYEWSYADNNLKTGVSFRHLDLDEDISFTSNELERTYAGEYSRTEYIPGLFAEHTAQFLDGKLTWIAGVRMDRHNDFGIQITPRSLLKYDLTPTSSFRANIGKGWRTVNLFSENINLLVSSRDIIFEEDLVPEKALNYGINYTQKFESSNLSGYFSADFYRTEFQNQIFPDYDADPSLSIIKNFTGESVGNGFQTDLFIKFWQELEVKIAYNYLDVYRITGDSKIALPFNSKDKIFTSFSYKPVSNKFHLDLNAHWYGKQRMPNTQSNPTEYRRPDFSEEFVVVNSQFTYNFKDFEIYAGCENIFNFRQERPIISWQNPFGPYFDTSSVWGPTRGRELYLGFRYYVRAN
jgi:outer membrane receptor for ferrienterochelin and colicin